MCNLYDIVNGTVRTKCIEGARISRRAKVEKNNKYALSANSDSCNIMGARSTFSAC